MYLNVLHFRKETVFRMVVTGIDIPFKCPKSEINASGVTRNC